MAHRHLRKITLEVERKFSRLKVYPLTANGGCPAFEALTPLETRKFRDVYYDHDSLLSRAGTWVRQRDGQWESKIRQAGDYNNSQFKEIQDVDEISHHVHSIIKNSHTSTPSNANFGLSQIADITTSREAWKADDRFKIVLDRTDFGHVVGEVELEATVDKQSDFDPQKVCALMDSEVVTFMKRYHWAFDTSPAVGKLTAYFAQYPSQR